MAKLFETVEGYRPDMTPEEKVALFEGLEAPETLAHEAPKPDQPKPETPKPDPATVISKKRFDEVASELAATKRALRSRMTEEEQRAEEAKQKQAEMLEELEALRKEKTISAHNAGFLGLGMAADLAAESAAALADGDVDVIFANVKKHIESVKKSLLAEALRNTPRPPVGEEDAAKKARERELRKNFGLPV